MPHQQVGRLERFDAQGRQIRGRYTGAGFPFGAGVEDTLGPKSDVEVVVTSIANILTTPKGSVPYDPDLGSIVPLLQFEPLDEVTMGLFRYFAFKDLSEQETRAVFLTVLAERAGDHQVRVTPVFSLVGDPEGQVFNAPLVFRGTGVII